jgi:plasmid segregation protein ParM
MEEKKFMFKIGLDIGYGYVKGVNQTGKEVSFPSLVCEGFDRPLAGLFGGIAGSGKDDLHLVAMADGAAREMFVGELARREGRNVSFAFDEDKAAHPATRGLLAAAGYLLFPEGHFPVHLVTGLPLEQYIHKKDEFKQALDRFAVFVRHKERQDAKNIRFAKVTVFPQAAGAVYHAVWDDRSKYLCVLFLNNLRGNTQ